MYLKYPKKNTKLYSVEFLRTEVTSDGSYSLFQFERSDVISVFKISIEYSFVFLKCLLSRSYMWNILTRSSNTKLPSDVAGIVKPESCTCSQGQVLQQNCWNNVAEYSSI